MFLLPPIKQYLLLKENEILSLYNKLLYNNALDLFFVLVIVYHLEKGLDRTKPFKTEHILQGPWPFIIILKFHFTNDQ